MPIHFTYIYAHIKIHAYNFHSQIPTHVTYFYAHTPIKVTSFYAHIDTIYVYPIYAYMTIHALYKFIIFYSRIPILVYILLPSYTYTCLHTCTPTFRYMFTYLCAFIPRHKYILLRPYTPYMCLQSSTMIHIVIIVYILLLPYTKTNLHSTAIYLCMFGYGHIRPKHVYILLRSYSYTTTSIAHIAIL